MRVRLSVSARVFLGFLAIIVAFGSVGLYALDRMQLLRKNVGLVRKGVLPLTADLAALLRDIKVYEEELGARSDRDLVRLKSYFPSFRPFEALVRIQARIEALATQLSEEAPERALLAELGLRLGRLVTGSEFRSSLESSANSDVARVLFEAPEARENRALFDALARGFMASLHTERLEAARALEDELLAILRRLRNEVAEVRREARRLMAHIERTAESTEARAQLVISVATGIALLIALSVVIWVAFSLRPLPRLREAVRRAGAGDFAAFEPVAVEVRGRGDEIGELAAEFDRMAESLAERDHKLARQGEALVRSERLATIGRMSSQIAHEIRNPLSSIGLNTELLEDEIQALGRESDPTIKARHLEESRALGAAIRQEIDRLRDVTEQYLRFARLPSPARRPEELNALLRDVLAFTGGELASTHVVLEERYDDAVGTLALDEAQIRQAVLNLVRNAIEAMPGGGRLTVSTRRDGDQVRIAVEDTGSGVPDDVRERIFDPFFSTKASGTGLGLPLVLEIAQAHGGTVVCEPVAGAGTRFVLTLAA